MNPNNSQEALGALQQFQANAQDPGAILAGQQQRLGTNAALENVTGLRGAVANTTRLLNQVAPSVMGRTGNSLVTSAQATRQIGNEQAPIAQQLSSQGEQLGTATQDYDRLAQQAQQAAELQYTGQQNQRSYLQSIYDALYSKEKDARDFAEQQRQFNEQLSVSKANAASLANPSFDSAPATSFQDDPLKSKATDAVFSLFATNDKSLIQKTVDAIKASAGYGNSYDKLKLQLIQQLHPEYLKATPAPLKVDPKALPPNLYMNIAPKLNPTPSNIKDSALSGLGTNKMLGLGF